MERRDLLAGLACVAALGGAEWLRPRREVRLLPAGTKLSTAIPRGIPGWVDVGGGDIVIPRTEGSLQARLYSDELARSYQRAGASAETPAVMLLIAYGASQSDSLQLHRPEVCYPAAGFTVTAPQPYDLRLSNGAAVPAVMLTGTFTDRIEDIVYFSRLGETLPRSQSEQRRDRLRAALQGYIGDGVLVRASAVRSDPEKPCFQDVAAFLAAMVGATAPTYRPALIGTRLAGLG